MLIWCVGIEGSASTWMFNAVRETCACLWPGLAQESCYVAAAADLPNPESEASVRIVKSHAVEVPVANILTDWAQKVFVTIRDPRDCIASLMLYQRRPFLRALAAVERSASFCGDLMDRPGVSAWRFESGFADRDSSLDRIAGDLGGELAPVERARIFAGLRREAVESRIAAFGDFGDAGARAQQLAGGDMVDPRSQWHSHHAGRSGLIGRWRHDLEFWQGAWIEARMAEWMTRFGYAAERVISGAAPSRSLVG